MGYRCGLLREKFPDLIKCLSCEHAFSCSNNLYKLYRTFTDHRPQPKTVAKLQGGHRFISRQGLKPLSMESQTSGTFQMKAHQWWTRGTHSSAERKNYSNKPVRLRKVQEKVRRNQESSYEKRIHWTLRAHIPGRRFPQFLDVRNAKKSLLEQLTVLHAR